MGTSLLLPLTAASIALCSMAACAGDDGPADGEPAVDASSSGNLSSSGGSSGGALTPVAKEVYFAELAKAICSDMRDCCAVAGYPYVEGACEESLRAAGLGDQALNDPDVVYDGVAAAECIEYTRASMQCNLTAQEAEALATKVMGGSLACQRALSGRKQTGEECTYGECAVVTSNTGYAQTSCAPAERNGPSVCQTMHLQTTVGAPCEPLDAGDPSIGANRRVCYITAAGLAMRPETEADRLRVYEETLVCKEGTCQRVGDVAGRLNQPCGFDDLCEPAAVCSNGTCVARAGVGQPCAALECELHLNCDDLDLVCNERKPSGAACQDDDECSVGDCVNGRCTPNTPATPERCGGVADGGND